MTGRLDGKVALITGAGSGQGRAAALLFAGQGAAVAVAEVDEPSGEATAEQIRSSGGRAVFVPCDVADAEQVEAAVAKTVAELGGLHVLYNNAGVWYAAGGNYRTACKRRDGRDRRVDGHVGPHAHLSNKRIQLAQIEPGFALRESLGRKHGDGAVILLCERAREFRIRSVSRLDRDQMSTNPRPEKREVSDDIENFMAHELIRKP